MQKPSHTGTARQRRRENSGCQKSSSSKATRTVHHISKPHLEQECSLSVASTALEEASTIIRGFPWHLRHEVIEVIEHLKVGGGDRRL